MLDVGFKPARSCPRGRDDVSSEELACPRSLSNDAFVYAIVEKNLPGAFGLAVTVRDEIIALKGDGRGPTPLDFSFRN